MPILKRKTASGWETITDVTEWPTRIPIQISYPYPETWDEIAYMVRHGLGEQAFPVGFQFTTAHSEWGNILWDVVGHDIYQKPNDPGAHTMTLMAHYTSGETFQFDAGEAMYYAASALAAGAYTFKVGTTSYYFRLAGSIPAGGQLVINSTPSSFTVYGSAGSTSSIETGSVSTTAISGATDLGTLGSGSMNNWDRIRYGSNNYKESAIRQYLNSSAAAGSAWSPQTHFDRPPSWASSKAGFMAGLPADFLSAVGEVDVKCKTNGVYEAPGSATAVPSTYTVRDRFYPASQKEIFNTEEAPADGSVLFPYYSGAAAVDRIKYKMDSTTTAQLWWTRTAPQAYAYASRIVKADGSYDSYVAYNSYGIAPCCTIY